MNCALTAWAVLKPSWSRRVPSSTLFLQVTKLNRLVQYLHKARCPRDAIASSTVLVLPLHSHSLAQVPTASELWTMCSDASRAQNTTCQYPQCHRGVWQDPDGSYSAYCGASHRDAMRQLSGDSDPAAGSVTLCMRCAARPVYIQDGKGTRRISPAAVPLTHHMRLTQSTTSAVCDAAGLSGRARRTSPALVRPRHRQSPLSASSPRARSWRLWARLASPANTAATRIACQFHRQACMCLPALKPYASSEAVQSGAAEKCLRYFAVPAVRVSETDEAKPPAVQRGPSPSQAAG